MSLGETVNVKMIRDKLSGSNAGYCFLDFANPEGAMRHLNTINGSLIPGTTRVFKLNWASGGGSAGMMGGGRGDDRGPEYSIFVGDLGPDVTDYLLLQTFQARYMTCKSAKVVTDPASGMSRGYGFVRFSDEMEQQRALAEMQGQFCGTRAMRISMATPKNNAGAAGGAGAVMSPVGGAMGGMAAAPVQSSSVGISGMVPHQPQPYYQQSAGPPQLQIPPQQQQQYAAGYNQHNDPTNTTVFVGGLNTQIADEELRSYFAPFGEIVYTKIPPGKGCGFVQFVHRQSAELAIAQMNGFMIAGSRVRLSWGRSQAIPKADYRPSPSTPYGAGGTPYGAPMAGAAGYPPFQPYPQHQLPQQPPPVVHDPLAPVSVEKMNAEFLRRKEEALVDQGVRGEWRRGVYA
ncbi:hypothetical protein PhCBS80983_g04793 [Powellomyces hirtus]|uniref:RRM domain-containing protein n=1 Tax=Powellomyces hirtus TaxID=109895 RepID=A0A507DYQ6_9FUNG|nr:hypothetical protein PhCBS80983_g04793 [Powellomyces hirtus]